MADVFEDGHVDVAIFQSTYLKEWYTEGFNTTERNATLLEKYPGQVRSLNGRWDPRDGEAGLRQLEPTTSSATGCKGVKLYTAEWQDGSRGWKLNDPEAYRFLEQVPGARRSRTSTSTRARRSGRWTRTPSTSSDVDHAATDFPELNFIVEHVGLPRIEDFCFMATQEPNVYAGLVGRHRRPDARPAAGSSPR